MTLSTMVTHASTVCYCYHVHGADRQTTESGTDKDSTVTVSSARHTVLLKHLINPSSNNLTIPTKCLKLERERQRERDRHRDRDRERERERDTERGRDRERESPTAGPRGRDSETCRWRYRGRWD